MQNILNLFNAPILAFFLGIIAVILGSDLSIPKSIGKFISLYLLFSIGYKGGIALVKSTWQLENFLVLSIGLVMALITPFWVFAITKKRMTIANAGAMAATYGSISVVTFITASNYLDSLKVSYGGHMTALMALMESPAIIISIFLVRRHNDCLSSVAIQGQKKWHWYDLFCSGPIIILLGSMCIGLLSQPNEVQSLYPFIFGIQKGMLVFFLLDMGLLVGKRLLALRHQIREVILFGLLIPIANAIIGLLLTFVFKINIGDSFLLVILLASGSYIAVPAAFKLIVPEAAPSIYLSAALAITFPFNVIIGIPLYWQLLQCIMK